jgi:Uncharacterised protein family UPF0047
MPPTNNTQSLKTTLILLIVLLLAFFPNLFHHLWHAPLSLLLLPTALFRNPAPDPPASSTMSWFQKNITLPARSRGSYLITDEIVAALPELQSYRVGLLNLFVQHTSCALSLNENWDADVLKDMSDALDRIVPEDHKGVWYRHAAEGRDDMPVRI